MRSLYNALFLELNLFAQFCLFINWEAYNHNPIAIFFVPEWIPKFWYYFISAILQENFGFRFSRLQTHFMKDCIFLVAALFLYI